MTGHHRTPEDAIQYTHSIRSASGPTRRKPTILPSLLATKGCRLCPAHTLDHRREQPVTVPAESTHALVAAPPNTTLRRALAAPTYSGNPALAVANVGIAMGGIGTDVALETADVVLSKDDVSMVPYAVALGLKSLRIIRQNLAIALTVIVALVLSDLLGLITLPWGVVGHEGSTLLVTLNGLRLLRRIERPSPDYRGGDNEAH